MEVQDLHLTNPLDFSQDPFSAVVLHGVPDFQVEAEWRHWPVLDVGSVMIMLTESLENSAHLWLFII